MTPSTAHGSTPEDYTFELVEKDEIGYEPTHVDAFMERARRARTGEGELTAEQVRQVRFATIEGGYATDQVDDELDRLEAELTAGERERVTSAGAGAGAWDDDLASRSAELVARADRAPAERFRRPSVDSAEGYDVDEVDELVDRLRVTLADEGSAAPVGVDDVRRATFRSVSDRGGYDEAQVDAYLEAAVDVLLRRA